MSSLPPTRAALDRAIAHNSPTSATTGTQARVRREHRPTERAQYISDERRDRELQWQKPKAKTRPNQDQENRAPRDVGCMPFVTQHIDLSTPKTTPALDLRPQIGRVPPLNIPSTRHSSSDSVMTQDSGFINGPHGYYGNLSSPLAMVKWRLTAQDLFPNDNQQQELSGDDDEGDENPYAEQAHNDQYDDISNESGDDVNVNGIGKRARQSTEDPCDDESQEGSVQDGKRARTSTNSDDQGWRNPKKIQKSNGRVAAKDYEVAVQEILKIAIHLFRSRLTAENVYPDRITQIAWAKEAWAEACKECEAQVNFNNEVIQLITNRTWHLTSELKIKIRPLVEVMYGFESSTKAVVQAHNRKLVEELTADFGFCYKTPGDPINDVPRKGLYEHKIIQKAVNMAFYKDKRDEGIQYSQYFEPFPEASMALILTVIEACIDKWSSGKQCDILFNEPIYKPIYQLHLSQLRKFGEYMKDHAILPKLLKRLNDSGCCYAKVEVAVDNVAKRVLQEDAMAAAIRDDFPIPSVQSPPCKHHRQKR
ncbi:hypothetical protein PAXINDRAFT_17359 [Paxillus involutus ATCC 200175]|uniref:DUF6532 domain-containing protein n=1 Tax=Paxillus involutus ATCC 200175 TaxID=664439 RepID=A0A0C9TF43_PAXIN|nr:hypothetical protein PAXINDRAFT_17359 [Paxillus involutus ATCC 200175]